ncbi:MAG TPA: sigma 54-interacting transcriptional regulator, partial [Methylomirabilota bacterium]|nr:sigma 54-interacting transcriptional regulator [Methylomirabilota bacterium]
AAVAGGDAEPVLFHGMWTRDPGMKQTFRIIEKVAAEDVTVLVRGETGAGKELVAHALHVLSPRRDGPFRAINCAALPPNLLESELFGHVRGAFTDAKHESRGVVGQANGGTLFLDEVDSLSPRAQAAILRFVEDHVYRPIGAPRFQHGDVRVLAASNVDLQAFSRQGRFREDLLYRLTLLTLTLPPLRARAGDALLLAEAFVRRFCQQYGTSERRLDAASIAALERPQPWPGNVRELEHRVHRSFLLSKGPLVSLDPPTAPSDDPSAPAGISSFAEAKAHAIAEFERRYVGELLAQAKGNLSLAARLAGKERSRFGKLVKKYGLQRSAFATPS